MMTPAIAVDVLKQAVQPINLNGRLNLGDLALCFQALQTLEQLHPVPKHEVAPAPAPAAAPVKDVVPSLAEAITTVVKSKARK